MCGISGFFSREISFLSDSNEYKCYYGEKAKELLCRMNEVQRHRGPDGSGICLGSHCGLAQVRLSILDLANGKQPMIQSVYENGNCILTYGEDIDSGNKKLEDKKNETVYKKQIPNGWILQGSIVYNGEIYNMNFLRHQLEEKGCTFSTNCDTEVILAGFLEEGPEFVKKLNGIFSFAIWEETSKKLWLYRDRLGVKPLFYMWYGGNLFFSSEIKGLLSLLESVGETPKVTEEGLCEVLALGPAKTIGKGVIEEIQELKPAHFLCIDMEGQKEGCYWELKSKYHEDSYKETVEKTKFLVEDAVTMQMLSDIPISTFLSGGIDSSIVTAICAKNLPKGSLNTFSFDFEGNQKFFKANAFQPSEDRPFVEKMVDYCHTNHRYLECDNENLLKYLYQSVEARDLPGMADVESSLLYFCSKVVQYNKVTLTGECADEIFGGYPWFHKKEMLYADVFPWSQHIEPRQVLLKDDIITKLPMEEYAREAYCNTVRETPKLPGESFEEARRREIAWLNLRWFMITLLDRMDRTSMYSGLEARVPFADHRIVEYIWNVPWHMKCPNGVTKGLLRDAAREWLPEEVLYRKKSPYPKTYNPEYEKILGVHLMELLTNPQEPIRQLVDIKKVKVFLNTPSDYGKPWYGQLMAGPQMLAYMIQINAWLKKYKIEIVL